MPRPSVPSGTITIFCQVAAPVGWTKLTTLNDYALRIVNGAVSTGGSSPFTTCFTDAEVAASFSSSLSVGSYTISTSEMASHSHPSGGGTASPIGQAYFAPAGQLIYQSAGTQSIGPAGGGGSHSHTVPGAVPAPVTFPGGSMQTLSLRYIDVIQCSRN
jgi:hypothetical protein